MRCFTRRPPSKCCIIFIVLFICLSETAAGQDSLSVILKGLSLPTFAPDRNKILTCKACTFLVTPNDDLLDVIFRGQPFVKSSESNGHYNHFINGHLNLENCRFFRFKNDTGVYNLRRTDSYSFDGNLYLTGSSFEESETLQNIRILNGFNAIQVSDDRFPALYLQHIEGSLDISDCYFKEFCLINESKIPVFNFTSNRFRGDSEKLTIGKTNFSQLFTAEISLSDDSYFLLAEDSISGSFSMVSYKRPERKNSKLDLIFKKCYLNGTIISDFNKDRSMVNFTDCTFGPDANLSNLGFDTVIFKNCFNIPSPVFLSFPTAKENIWLSLDNSNLTNIKFDFDKRLHLKFDSSANKDLKTNTYENLLAKFKTEGKFDSYRNVDVLYQRYLYSLDGVWGSVKNRINQWWWYYGYRKYYVLYWTAFFLGLFFVINYVKWGQMQEVYPLIPGETHTFFNQRKDPPHSRFRLATNIFIYTAFIFFSLKIDFDKLNYRKTAFLLCFFIQYIVGLACMFFIANAILKI